MKSLLVLLFCVSQAHASIIYNWTGDCDSGCVGPARMELVVKDGYVPGTPFVIPGFFSPGDGSLLLNNPLMPFTSFTMTNGIKTVTFLNRQDGTGINQFANVGGLGGTLTSGIEPFEIWFNSFGDNRFTEHADGSWVAGFEDFFSVRGTNGVFIQAVPEPATLGLLLSALLGIALYLTTGNRTRRGPGSNTSDSDRSSRNGAFPAGAFAP